MEFHRLLTFVAARILVGLAGSVWAIIAVFDQGREALRAGFAVGALLAAVTLVGLARGWPAASVAGAIALFGPIGLLAQANGASPWAWLFWLGCAALTERWLRDAGNRPGSATGR